jgi:hypothetical protein
MVKGNKKKTQENLRKKIIEKFKIGIQRKMIAK